MMKKVGRTVPAVRTGCQAGKRCCLKAESEEKNNKLIADKRKHINFTLKT